MHQLHQCTYGYYWMFEPNYLATTTYTLYP
jgi:hypothetical protein